MSVITDLKRHEGFRATPYLDTEGHSTIGYGVNLDAGISEIEATMLLEHRVRLLQDELRARLPFFSKLTQARQDVLTNMSYNLGVEGLMKFINTLRYIEAGEYDKAAEGMLKSKWSRQVGRRAVELSEVMRKG